MPGVLTSTIKLVVIGTNAWELVGLRHFIEQHSRVQIVGDAGTAGSAIQAIKIHRPSLVLIDIDDLGSQTYSVVRDVRMFDESIRIVLLSAVNNSDLVKQAFDQGVAAVVFKIQPPQVLMRELESLADEGGARPGHRSPAIAQPQMPAKVLPEEHSSSPRIGTLTAREREIISYIGKGLTNKEIALRLNISFITVRHHLTRIFSKLGIGNRQKLLLYAHAHKLVSRPAIPGESSSSD